MALEQKAASRLKPPRAWLSQPIDQTHWTEDAERSFAAEATASAAQTKKSSEPLQRFSFKLLTSAEHRRTVRSTMLRVGSCQLVGLSAAQTAAQSRCQNASGRPSAACSQRHSCLPCCKAAFSSKICTLSITTLKKVSEASHESSNELQASPAKLVPSNDVRIYEPSTSC